MPLIVKIARGHSPELPERPFKYIADTALTVTSVPNSPGKQQGTSKSPEAGPPITVCPRRRNPGTALFGLDCGSSRMIQCFPKVGEDRRPAKGLLGGNRGAVCNGGSDRTEGFSGVKRSIIAQMNGSSSVEAVKESRESLRKERRRKERKGNLRQEER